MTLNEVIKIVNGKTKLNSNEEIKRIKTDTRKIEKGDVFIALKGKNYDGNSFVEEAIKKGAIACITEYEKNDRCIKVDSTIKSLFALGNYIRNKYNIPLVAITGSNGKTTTKDLLYNVLSTRYNVLKNEGNKNNIIGVSETLFKLNSNHDIVVMEFGSNHIGEIRQLSLMCNPTLAIITNIGSSHIGHFKNKKNIFKEKTSIIDGMYNKKLIVNGDDKYLKKLKGIRCGLNKKNDLIAYNIEEYIDYISFNIYLDKEYKIVFNNPGVHFINNILLVIKTGLYYNISIEDIIESINNYTLTNMRMNIVRNGSNTIINDCYNSSLESLSAGINYLKNINQEKILVIGDILELGKHSKKIHKKINRILKKLNNKEVFTIGEYSKYINGKHFKTVDDFIKYIKLFSIQNKYIYIKGSRRINLDKFYDYIK